MINESRLNVLIFLWGTDYLEMFRCYSLPSLLGQYPRPHLHFLIYTIAERKGAMEVLFSSLPFRDASYEIFLMRHQCTPSDPPPHYHLGVAATRDAIRRSRVDNCRLLWLTPDMMFGDRSIANMMDYAKGNPVTVAAIDLRAELEIIQKKGLAFSQMLPLSNKSLVRLALNHPHQCTTSAIDGTGCFHSGQSIRQLSTPGLWSIVYRIPTAFLCYFTEADQAFWDNWKSGIGAWDHVWPEMLVREARFRFLGNSDAAFVLHLTGRDHAHAPETEPRFDEAFYRRALHHDTLGNFVGTISEL